MDNVLDYELEILEPQPDWLTDEEVEKIEQELVDLEKTAAEDIKTKRQKELALLDAFKKNPTKDTFTPLYQSYKPFIMKAAQKNMFGSPIPQAAHQAHAAQSFLDATRTFDPKKGSSFNTHVFNTVQEKGKRLNLKYQNIAYIPESRATKYSNFNTEMHILKEELGREPSTTELSDAMGIPPKEVERLRMEIKKDLIMRESLVHQGAQFAQSDKAMQVARDIHYMLEPKHQLVLEYTLGMYGRPSMVKKSGKADITAIAKAANISVADVRSARKTINRKFQEFRGAIGKDNKIEGIFEDAAEE